MQTADTREWRNRQTRTFEGRVVIPYGFKSRLSHQNRANTFRCWLCFYMWDLNPKRVRSVKKTVHRTVFSSEVRDGYCRFGGGRRGCRICEAKPCPVSRTTFQYRKWRRYVVFGAFFILVFAFWGLFGVYFFFRQVNIFVNLMK